MAHQDINVAGVLEEAPMGPVQYGVIAMCFALIMVDGFDTQNVAFVAPALRDAWDVSPSTFGLLFSAGLTGSMLGAMLLGVLGDRLGRRPLILGSTIVFSVMSLLSATAPNVETLAIYRFIGGLGLGGLLPNAIALVAEYSPRRVRSTMVVSAFIGFPLGAVLGGMASARIIPAFGWEMVFIAGGVIPLLLLVVVWWQLPESLRFLAMKRAQPEKILRTLVRIQPDLADRTIASIRAPEVATVQQPLRTLFRDGRGGWTVYLWLLTFCSLLLTYFLVHWIPLVLVDAGIAQQSAIMGVALLNLGGIIGSLIIGRWSDKRGPYLAMGLALVLAIGFISMIGFSVQAGVAVLLSVIFFAGLTFVGAQLNISALAATNYPVEIRSAGTGASIAAGRVGSIVGPLVGGILISRHVETEAIFLVAIIPAAIALAAIVAMARIKRKAGAEISPAVTRPTA
ncbi:MAG: MFS transporter [Gammaproteobacteria bacterium]|nr:MFS transporter [Gammaproteobacteria bacterium]